MHQHYLSLEDFKILVYANALEHIAFLELVRYTAINNQRLTKTKVLTVPHQNENRYKLAQHLFNKIMEELFTNWLQEKLNDWEIRVQIY